MNFQVVQVAKLLVIAGALNWLSIGLTNTDFVGRLSGSHSKLVFILIGCAGLYLLYKEIINKLNGN
jgi:uncharacterized membrane protein YuzA (DUF378 family)